MSKYVLILLAIPFLLGTSTWYTFPGGPEGTYTIQGRFEIESADPNIPSEVIYVPFQIAVCGPFGPIEIKMFRLEEVDPVTGQAHYHEYEDEETIELGLRVLFVAWINNQPPESLGAGVYHLVDGTELIVEETG
jgi:hypothetical protein